LLYRVAASWGRSIKFRKSLIPMDSGKSFRRRISLQI
jgi:hypothetical protein